MEKGFPDNAALDSLVYHSPIVEVIDVEVENCFCQSGTEGLDEKPGKW